MAPSNTDVMLRLGYNPLDKGYDSYLASIDWFNDYQSLPEYQKLGDRVQHILTQLRELESLILDVRSNSMAVSVGELKLNYVQHIRHLNLDGRHLENQLSRLTGVPLKQSGFIDFRRPVSYLA